MKPKTLDRRTLLRGAGALTGLPFLEAMRPAFAQAPCEASPPKRLIVFYSPNGTVPKDFWPSQVGRNFQLSSILAPLERHKQDLVIVGGCDIITGNRGPGDPHQRGTGACLTGRPLLTGTFSGDSNEVAGWASGISLDQQVARTLGKCTRFPSLEFGVMVENPTVRGRISYTGAGKPLPPENSPSKLYERVFEPGLTAGEKALRRERRRHVVDRTLSQYRDLRGRLGSSDQQRLDSHVESLVELDAQLSRPGVEFGGACQPLSVNPALGTAFDYSQILAVGAAQLDVLALMFRCDITRVATVMWTHSQSTASYPINLRFGNTTFTQSGGHHGLAHKGDGEAEFVAKNGAVNRLIMEQIASLIDRLKAIPEGNGTVFDNTLILYTNEQNKGNSHDLGDMPYLLAGSAGGAVDTGQYLRFAPTLAERRGVKGESHNRMLVTVLRAMGLSDTSFGDTENPALGTDVLPGILRG